MRRTAAASATPSRRSSLHEATLAVHGAGPSRLTEQRLPQELAPAPRSLPFKRPASPPASAQLPPQSRAVSGTSQSSSLLSPLGGDLQNSLPQPTTPPSERSAANNDDELQELRAKIRVLEAHRADDARHTRELETQLSEAKSFAALGHKLQTMVAQKQTDLIATRRELADAQQLAELSETRLMDSQEQLEMATLDKEVAEERAEAAESELEELREKVATLEVELGVIKEGAEGGTGEDGVESNVATSLAYIQLEKQNSRLKEALFRLRDVSQETEQDQRRRIQEMEKDIMNLDELQNDLESTLIKLANADTQIEDLKVQLDDALGAEEMLIQLTERNLMLGEKIEEMRISIEDLEALKELNDELEENHIETEKAMQDEINDKDVQLSIQQRKIESLEEACLDLEGTIGQFRELVLQLQSDLDALRMQTHTAQTESAAAASQSAAMMSLNMRLQSTASKNQAKNIDLEVKRIEAREARELLGIVQPYLPQLYVETDSDATQCYLFFQRMALKADLINMVTAQAHGLPDALNGPVSDILVGVTEMRGSIAALSTIARRFAAILRRCDVESFLNIGRLYPEIAPMEKRIDIHIDLLRREEFREMECASDINKIQAQFDHLAETYFQGFEFDIGERELGFVLSFDHDLDVYASAIGLAKTAVEAALADEDIVSDVAGVDPAKEFFEPLQKTLDQCKSAKIVSRKLTKRLEDLTEQSSALKTHLAPQLKALSDHVSELVDFGIQLAQQTMPHIADARASKAPFQLAKVISLVRDTALATVGKTRKDAASAWDALGSSMSQLISTANALLPVTMENENIVKIVGAAPWVLRVEEIKASIAINVEAERKLTQLNEELQGLIRNLKAKDQHIQESAVKIELMERRMEGVKKQADAIADLEAELFKARKQERSYEDAMEQLQADLDTMEQENAKLKANTMTHERQTSGAPVIESESIAVEGSLETSHLLEQIEAFRGAVRFLRMENSYLKGQDLLREIQDLPPLPAPTSRTPTPPLDASGLSDTDDSDSDSPSPPPPTLRSLATERKSLYRKVIQFSSSPKVVDLSVLGKGGAAGSRAWMPRNKLPAAQVLERKKEAERLGRRVQGLMERTSAIMSRMG
ncbi:dynein associated protein-domain-containing protein [Amylostereum chailletii]|nr:dynein associated protein-domain-containing protein [Amylostereum chailletii]